MQVMHQCIDVMVAHTASHVLLIRALETEVAKFKQFVGASKAGNNHDGEFYYFQ
jgi:hypothetical protein